MNKDNGGPAFPFAATDNSNVEMEAPGMTLRDYFAAKAMQWIWSVQGIDFGTYDNQARVSYEMADAMLRARE